MCQTSLQQTSEENLKKKTAAGTAGSNLSTSCGQGVLTKIKNTTYDQVKGSTNEADCVNNQRLSVLKSNFGMSQKYVSVKERDWVSHVCYNYRASNDIDEYVRAIAPGNVIEFRAGFNLFDSATGTNTINSDSDYNDKKSYTITDGAVALAASSLVSAAVISQLSF